MSQAKTEIRKALLDRRKALASSECTAAGRNIVAWLTDLDIYRQADCVALFMPIQGEVDLRALLVAGGRTYCFPRVSGEELEFVAVDSLADFVPGSFGVPEPRGARLVMPEELGLVLVPGLAFDRRGYRLGYGKGYYDRLLAANPGLCACGICMRQFFVDELPADAWDQRVGLVVMEDGIHKTEIR